MGPLPEKREHPQFQLYPQQLETIQLHSIEIVENVAYYEDPQEAQPFQGVIRLLISVLLVIATGLILIMGFIVSQVDFSPSRTLPTLDKVSLIINGQTIGKHDKKFNLSSERLSLAEEYFGSVENSLNTQYPFERPLLTMGKASPAILQTVSEQPAAHTPTKKGKLTGAAASLETRPQPNATPSQFELEGIVYNPHHPIAVVKPQGLSQQVVKPGSTITGTGIKVLSITEKAVVLEDSASKQQWTLIHP